MRGRVRFVGLKSHGELQGYARSLDVAKLPYRKKEPAYPGSSTRFYEHLAAFRPMVATRGCAELTEKVPLLLLADTGKRWPSHSMSCRSRFTGMGLRRLGGRASRMGSWEERARTRRGTLD